MEVVQKLIASSKWLYRGICRCIETGMMLALLPGQINYNNCVWHKVHIRNCEALVTAEWLQCILLCVACLTQHGRVPMERELCPLGNVLSNSALLLWKLDNLCPLSTSTSCPYYGILPEIALSMFMIVLPLSHKCNTCGFMKAISLCEDGWMYGSLRKNCTRKWCYQTHKERTERVYCHLIPPEIRHCSSSV